MAIVYSVHPRTTAERAECGDFARRLRTRDDLPKGVIFRIDHEVVPALATFGTARAANSKTASRATRSGRAFRASSAVLRAALEGWMRAIDVANSDTGYAEKHLRVHFGNRPLSRLWDRDAHFRLETVEDLLAAVAEDPSLHGSDATLARVRTDLVAAAVALDAYDGALEARKGTVDTLNAANTAFDFEYNELADRLLRNDAFARLVPRFGRTRGEKAADPELELEPEVDEDDDAAAPPSEPTAETDPE
jgi:hypothetical protein